MQQDDGNENTTHRDDQDVQEKPSPHPSPAPQSSRHFPQTLVAMDPPTLPASNLTPAPAEFRQFATPQRSVPGHPEFRSRLRRILTFWRRG